MSGPAADAATISGPGWSGATSPMAACMATPSPMVGSSSVASSGSFAGQPGRTSRRRARSRRAGCCRRRRPGRGAPTTAAPSPMFSGSVVLLLRADDDLGPAVAGEVGQRRRRDELAALAHARVLGEGHLVGARVDRLHLGRVDEQHREAVDRRAVVVPRVEVAVERRRPRSRACRRRRGRRARAARRSRAWCGCARPGRRRRPGRRPGRRASSPARAPVAADHT